MLIRRPKARRALVSSLILVVCILILVAGLQLLRQRGKTKLESRLIDAAARSRSGETTVLVDLATAAEFEWDQVYIIGPYTPVESIRDNVRISLLKHHLHEIDTRDDVVLLLFLRGDEVVMDLAFPRRHADLLPLVRLASYKRSHAKIEFVRRDGEIQHDATAIEVIARHKN